MRDVRIIYIAQNLYDWTFDRTGLYKGHILYLAIMLYIGMSFILGNPIVYYPVTYLFFGGLLAFSFWMNSKQQVRQYEWLNLYAHNCSVSPLIFMMRVTGWFLLICRCLQRDSGWNISLGFVILLYFYISCVKVRDREPPEKLNAAFNRG